MCFDISIGLPSCEIHAKENRLQLRFISNNIPPNSQDWPPHPPSGKDESPSSSFSYSQ